MTSTPLPMFPLGLVLFPHQTTGLCIFEQRYHQLLSDIENGQFGTCLIERGSEVGGGDERTSVGTLVEVVGRQDLPDGRTLIAVEALSCFEITEWLPDDPYPRAMVSERCCDQEAVSAELLAATETAVRALRTLHSECNPEFVLEAKCELSPEPSVRIWQLVAVTPMSLIDQFAVLRLSSPNARLEKVLEICCERYGDLQLSLAADHLTLPFD